MHIACGCSACSGIGPAEDHRSFPSMIFCSSCGNQIQEYEDCEYERDEEYIFYHSNPCGDLNE